MGDVRALAWFVWTSWRYLGCDRGTGRWAARRLYVAGLPGAARTFLAFLAADRRERDGV